MARKYTKNEIEATGLYEVRLHGIDDKEFLESKKLCVYQGYGTDMLVYDCLNEDSDLSSLSSLYDEYMIYQRKLCDLPCPYTFRTKEDYNEWRNKNPSLNLKLPDKYLR